MKVYVNLNLRQRVEEAAAKADSFWSQLSQRVEKLVEVASTKINEVFEEIKAKIAEQCELVEDSNEAELAIVTDAEEAIKMLEAGKEVIQLLYGQEPVDEAAVASIGAGAFTRLHTYAVTSFMYHGEYPDLTGLVAFLVNRLGPKQTPPADAAKTEPPA